MEPVMIITGVARKNGLMERIHRTIIPMLNKVPIRQLLE